MTPSAARTQRVLTNRGGATVRLYRGPQGYALFPHCLTLKDAAKPLAPTSDKPEVG